MSEVDNEESCCETIGGVYVCVANNAWIGDKKIRISLSNDKEEFFKTTEEAIKYLKKNRVPRNDRTEIIKFVSPKLKPVRKIDNTKEGDVSIFGQRVGAKQREAKEL